MENYANLVCNPWFIPTNIDAEKWIETVIHEYAAINNISGKEYDLFKNFMTELYISCGVLENNTKNNVNISQSGLSAHVNFSNIHYKLIRNFCDAKEEDRNKWEYLIDKLESFVGNPDTLTYHIYYCVSASSIDFVDLESDKETLSRVNLPFVTFLRTLKKKYIELSSKK